MNLPLSNVPNHTKIWITKKERVGGGGGWGVGDAPASGQSIFNTS